MAKYDILNNVKWCFFTGSVLPAGIHHYPFHFALPPDLPSTFDSSVAKITYTVKIQSKPAYKLRKLATFNVFANVNINHMEEYLVGILKQNC